MAYVSELANAIREMNQQNQTTNEQNHSAMMAVLNRLEARDARSRSTDTMLGAPRKVDTEFLIESLSKSMREFTFDLDTNNTFKNWFSRYKSLFENDASRLDDQAKIRLLLRKFDTKSFDLYVNMILPKEPSDFTFEATIQKLSEVFKRRESVFRMRYNSMNIRKTDDSDGLTYFARINKAVEAIEFGNITVDQYKCMLFVKGLESPTDLDRRTVLLSLLEKDNKITMERLLEEYEKISANKSDSTLIGKTEPQNSILLNKVSNKKEKKATKCKRCGESHKKDKCPAFDKTCEFCQKKGHIEELCFKRKHAIKESLQNNSKESNDTKSKSGKKNVSKISINQIEKMNRKYIDILINGNQVALQIDTAADISVISKKTCSELNLKYSNTEITPNDASGNQLSLIGEIDCDIVFNDQTCHSTLYVSRNEHLNVFGIDLLYKFGLWNKPINDFCSNRINVIQTDYATYMKTNFPTCFETTLGKCIQYKATLKLKPNERAPFCKSRPVPFAIQVRIENELKRLQSIGVICHTTTADCAAPIVVIQKKTGDLRICADFSTGLNNALEDHRYPLPLPEDIFAKLNGSTIFSHIDLSDAFLQVEVDEESSKLLVINTHIGLFKYNRMSFGIKTAPTLFQEIMDKMIAGLDGVICYMDDIFICGKTKIEHDKRLIRLMNRIAQHGFHIKLAKSRFALTEIKYLGCIINKDGIKPDPQRIEAIQNMPAPSNLTELRSFLGTVNFYGKFIANMHNRRTILDELLQKDNPWEWTKKQQTAFNQLKRALSSELLLAHFNPNYEIIVSADASIKGVGACIQHKLPDGSIKPIAYASRSLQKSEKQYSQIEKEGLAIIFAIKKFHKYIFGRYFNLQTDHKPLLAIFGSKKGIPIHTANRLQRWAIILLAYNFHIQYINTSSFQYVDMLSRLIGQNDTTDQEIVIASIRIEQQMLQLVNDKLQSSPITYNQLLETYKYDPILQSIIKFVTTEWEKSTLTDNEEFQQFYNRRESLSFSNGLILFGERIVIPTKLREKIFIQLHQGHQGMEKMKSLARSYVYWPNIDKQIEMFVKMCSKCALFSKSPTKTLLHSWPTPTNVWERLHIDYAGPFKNTYFLVVIDAYSKWPEIIRTNTTSSSKTTAILASVFARFGSPLQIVSDNGSQFTSDQFQSFCKINGIEHIRTSPYHPMSNGQAERFVDTFKRSLKKLDSEGNLDDNLDTFLKAYRTTPNKNCPDNKSPAEIVFKRKIRSVFDLLKPLNSQTGERNTKMEIQFNVKHGAKFREFELNDRVYVQVHGNNTWRWKEGIIVKRDGKVNYTVKTYERDVRAHTNQIKKRYTKSNDESNSEISFSTLLSLPETT